MSQEETPISKYLATLERRRTGLLTPSPTADPNAIIRKINFEDDTFLQHDQSVIRISPSPDVSRAGTKRKRLSILGEAFEEEENQNKKLNDLERLLRQTQGELIDARATNTKLEYQISQNKRCHEERILGFQTSQNEMKTKMREAMEHAENWKDQLNKVSRKEEELREKHHQQTEAHFEKINAIEKKLRVLETENLELRGKFECGTVKQSDELRKLSVSLEETEMGAEKWVMETQMLRDQLELKEKQLQKYQNELKEVQTLIGKYNEMRAKYDVLKSPDGSSENLDEKIKYFENLYVKQQTENLRLVQNMEKISDENRMLRSSMNRELLLEEQISTFEEEVKILRSTLDTKAAVEAENGTLRSELSAWKTMAFKLDPDCTNYLKFESYIRKIQNQLLESKHEGSTDKLTIADRDRNISKAQAEITALQEQVQNLSTEKGNLTQDLKKVSRRLQLVTKDRDGLKELKESYEQEFEGVISKPLQERINQLEATVEEYEAMIQEDPSSKKACGECEKRIALISEIRTEMDRLKREKAEVESQIANLSSTGSGEDGDTTGIKIVSFGLNPSAMSLENRLKEAVKENEGLKEKLKEFQDQTVAGPSKASDGNLGELEDKTKTLERKLEILSEAYDFETQQLQLIISKLCGFHFTLVREPSVQIRLSSVYSTATTENGAFIFQESPNGDMLLLESPILDDFRDDIDRFLLREGSIPGFLSSVTIAYVRNQNSQDASQLPASQESAVDEEEASNQSIASESVRDPREIQVEVQRQRHPTSGDGETDEEDEDPNDESQGEDEGEDEVDEVDDVDDDDEEGMEEEHDGEEIDEEDEQYEEDRDDEYADESGEEEDLPPPSSSRPPAQPQSRQPAGDESDDSDVIMID